MSNKIPNEDTPPQKLPEYITLYLVIFAERHEDGYPHEELFTTKKDAKDFIDIRVAEENKDNSKDYQYEQKHDDERYFFTNRRDEIYIEKLKVNANRLKELLS